MTVLSGRGCNHHYFTLVLSSCLTVAQHVLCHNLICQPLMCVLFVTSPSMPYVARRLHEDLEQHHYPWGGMWCALTAPSLLLHHNSHLLGLSLSNLLCRHRVHQEFPWQEGKRMMRRKFIRFLICTIRFIRFIQFIIRVGRRGIGRCSSKSTGESNSGHR